MAQRVLLYSHDTFGMGNLRRTAELCGTIHSSVPDARLLVVTGSPHMDQFELPESTEIVKLPEVRREERGIYEPRAEGFQTEEVHSIRSEICLSVATRFSPDLVLVDKAPLGVNGELRPTLDRIGAVRPDCARVLGLRDILDDPEWVRQDWKRAGTAREILFYYDAVWVFGSPSVFDLREEYGIPEALRRKISFLGYLGRHQQIEDSDAVRAELGVGDAPLLVVTVGGGEDGGSLIRRYIEILPSLRVTHPELFTVFVSGPRADQETQRQLQKLCELDPRTRYWPSTARILDWMNAADGVVCMGGYNTACEVLLLQKPAVMVPRAEPVLEQQLRARRLAELGAVRCVVPEQLGSDALQLEIETILNGWTPTDISAMAPFTGLEFAGNEARKILAKSPNSPTPTSSPIRPKPQVAGRDTLGTTREDET